MKKLIVSIVVLLISIVIGFTLVNAISSTADLKINNSTIKPGDIFTVSLYVTCENEINGLITSFNYDMEKLELISAKAGTDFASLGEGNNIEIITNKNGIKAADVFIIEFKAKESILEETTTNISVNDITISPMDGDEENLSSITKTITIKPEKIENNQEINDVIANNENTTNTISEQENTTNTASEQENTNNNLLAEENNNKIITNNEQNSNEIVNVKENSLKSENSAKTNKTEKKEDSKKLPYTGVKGYFILGLIIILFVIAIIMFQVYKRYKDI